MAAIHSPRKGYKIERSILALKSDTTKAKTRGQQIALELRKTISHFFPDLFDRLGQITDPRKRHDYTITEILLGGTFLFICKEDSRNAFNNDRDKDVFLKNYERLFGKRLPHMDTVDDVMRLISNEELEKLRSSLISLLIEKKVFSKFRLLNQFHRVAVDASGVMNVKQGHCDHCLVKTSKNGKKTYFHNILEAKLVTPNGFSISLASEWIENPNDYDKQDCEQKAFKRLARKLKSHYPRLNICIHADGLYPNAPFFKICKENDWRYIVTLKDGNLKSLWQDIEMELLINHQNIRSNWQPQKKAKQDYRWLSSLSYQGHALSWVECYEKKDDQINRFVFLTDIEANFENVIELGSSGRMRFKIENEGFNTQKNQGYNLSHKFSRVSGNAMKNYVSLMQIAHLLNQLYERSSLATKWLVAKKTIKDMWKDLMSCLTHLILSKDDIESQKNTRIQLRYD